MSTRMVIQHLLANTFTPGLVISFLAFFLSERNANTRVPISLLYLTSLTSYNGVGLDHLIIELTRPVCLRFDMIKALL